MKTKDYEHESDMRQIEKYRIECAQVFFKALKEDGINVEFRKQLKNDVMMSIIDEVLKKRI